jgi:hypothetical protein
MASAAPTALAGSARSHSSPSVGLSVVLMDAERVARGDAVRDLAGRIGRLEEKALAPAACEASPSEEPTRETEVVVDGDEAESSEEIEEGN